MRVLGASPSAVHLQPDTYHWPLLLCTYPGGDCVATGEHVNIQGPTVACGSRSGPVFSHCAYLQLVLLAVHLPTPLVQTWLPVSTAMCLCPDQLLW